MTWVVGDPTPDSGSNSATIAVLDADIETLTATKNTVKIKLVKAAFESAVVILTVVRVRPCSIPFFMPADEQRDQNEVIDNDALVELAKYCVKACHVLKDVTQEMDANSLSSPSEKAINDFGRCVDQLSPHIDNNERYQNDAQHRVHDHRMRRRRP